MGPQKTLFVVVILGIILIAVEARLRGRRLRDGEPCDTPGFFGDAEDCRKFYRCAEHPTEDENNPILIRYTFRCPNGTVFHEDVSTCNHPEAVQDKPENCQPYDPDEGDMSMNMDNRNKGHSWGPSHPFLFGGLLHNQNSLLGQQHQPLTIPANQILYTSIPIPYANFIQYG